MPRSDKSIARSLGEFFGHIYRGIRTDPSEQRHEVSRNTVTETRDTPRGTVTLRKTTIEEIDLDPELLRPPEDPSA